MTDPILPPEAHDRRFLFILTGALAIFLTISFIVGSQIKKQDGGEDFKVAAKFPTVEIEAKSAYVYDARTQTVLFAHNENTRLPLASLTKVMSALVATEATDGSSTVTVDPLALKTEGDSGLRPGEKWSLKKLLDFSLITSSNDGIATVALAVGPNFVQKMNNKASELDLKNTYYWNATGLDESEVKGGAYSTAQDVAALMNYVVSYYPQTLEATREESASVTSLDNHPHLAKNTNTLVNQIPGLIASKTGYTETAGGNLAFVFDPELGRPIVVVILGSSAEGRFLDAEKLVKATLSYLNSK